MGIMDRIGDFAKKVFEGESQPEGNSNSQSTQNENKEDISADDINNVNITSDDMETLVLKYIYNTYQPIIKKYGLKGIVEKSDIVDKSEDDEYKYFVTYMLYGEETAIWVEEVLGLTDEKGYDKLYNKIGKSNVRFAGAWLTELDPDNESEEVYLKKVDGLKTMDDYLGRHARRFDTRKDDGTKLDKYLIKSTLDEKYFKRMGRIMENFDEYGIKYSKKSRGKYVYVDINIAQGLNFSISPDLVYHNDSGSVVYSRHVDSSLKLRRNMGEILRKTQQTDEVIDTVSKYIVLYESAVDLRRATLQPKQNQA